MSEEVKINESQLRLMRLIRLLSGHELHGLMLRDIAAGMKESEPTTYRDLKALEAGGWARHRDKTWCLGPEPIQIATHFYWGLGQGRAELNEIEQRCTRKPN
jgi:DNA-binding IclR family transcriptional regulator